MKYDYTFLHIYKQQFVCNECITLCLSFPRYFFIVRSTPNFGTIWNGTEHDHMTDSVRHCSGCPQLQSTAVRTEHVTLPIFT
jgi:hypothetical protein